MNADEVQKTEGSYFSVDADDALIRELADAVIWMSGSSDFSPGGIAHAGWIKTQPVLDKATKRLAARKP